MGDEIKRHKLATYLCRIYAERKDEDENRGGEKEQKEKESEKRRRDRK